MRIFQRQMLQLKKKLLTTHVLINEDEIKDVISEVKDCGCKISNIMQLIPVKESAFEYMGIVSNVDFNRIRKECESILPQMYHCKQCRADAIGTLNNDI